VAGRYEVEEKILEGRFSVLYRVRDRKEQRPLCLRALQDGEGEARRQILREGRLLARLEQRSLPRVLETIEDGGCVYLVLEDISGRTLEKVVAQAGPLGEEQVRRWLGQLLAALGCLHGQEPPWIHRDLRPDTLLVTPQGVLKLADFGMACTGEAQDTGQTFLRGQGSPHYAAPEQLMQLPSHPAQDLYSAGAVAYFMATAAPPPRSLEIYGGKARPRPIREVQADFPRALEALILELLAPEPGRRPTSAEEAYHRLQASFPVAPASVTLERALVEAARRHGRPAPPAGEGQRTSLWARLFGTSEARRVSAVEQTGPDEAELARYPFVDLSTFPLDREVARLLPETVSRSVEGICIGRRSASELTLAVKDPTAVHIHDHISFATQGKYRATLMRAEGSLIDLAREYVYRTSQPVDWLQWLERKKFASDALDVKTARDAAFTSGDVASPVVEAADRLIKEAISAGASDIHLETYENETQVRYRIDGVLHLVETYPPRMAPALVKRIKVLAGMDIAQERVPQGGRISVRIREEEYDLRVSIIPVVSGGENVVMRLLRKGAFTLTLSDLGFASRDEALFRRLLSQPYGMILVSGPTGSGKSTTLYASLKEIVRPDRKVLTVEDPVEYQMPGVSQVQVNLAPKEEERRVTFARALREFLRQDPDVILVGEIRDSETAGIAVQAALTGHLLLSTLHTNDAVGIVARLCDMGIEPFLLASTLIGGLAQRLVRRVCPGCARPQPTPESLKPLFERLGLAEVALARGAGCRQCHDTGYRGRLGLFELLEVTPEIREMVACGARESDLRRAAEARGFRSLYQDGLEKAARGLVTVEEVQRVCMTL
jgi:type IV pilus assembly protein PilB